MGVNSNVVTRPLGSTTLTISVRACLRSGIFLRLNPAVAQANVDANNLSGRVACVEAAGFDHPQLAEAAPFDLVFANILKGPLVALAPDMAGALQPAGYAILSGLLNEQADEVIEIYARSGINLVHRESIGDWTTLTLQTNA